LKKGESPTCDASRIEPSVPPAMAAIAPAHNIADASRRLETFAIM
jgi:hypothetical protein